MVKMDMRKIEDTTKRMEGEESLIEMRYRTTICNDCGLKPTKYFIVKGYHSLKGIAIIRIPIVTFVYRVRTNMTG